MRAQFEQQLASLQVSMDQYLNQSGKSQDELEEQWKPQAIKQAVMEVALAQIANDEKIDVTDEEVEAELDRAEPGVRQQFNDPRQKQYLAYSLWRQKVLKFILATIAENSKSAKAKNETKKK
jgi:trigger factor